MATAVGEDGKMVAVLLPLCFCIQTLVTLITAQNPGKPNIELLTKTVRYTEPRVKFQFTEKVKKNINLSVV